MEQFNDINGKESMKRIWANRILWVSLGTFILKVLISVIDAFSEKQYIMSFPTELWMYLTGMGLLALGFTLGEKKK